MCEMDSLIYILWKQLVSVLDANSSIFFNGFLNALAVPEHFSTFTLTAALT